MSWFFGFGSGLLGLLGFTALSLLLAGKFYRDSRQSTPFQVQALESELQSLRTAHQLLEEKQAATPPPPAPAAVTAAPTPTAPAEPAETLTGATSSSVIPSTVQLTPLKSLGPSSLQSVRISNLKIFWQSKVLHVEFGLHYALNDQGHQQGRILLVARGPATLLSHPAGVLNKAGSNTLFAPEKGEFFSVSRYREVKAEFGPLPAQIEGAPSIQEVEIFIFSQNGDQVLIYQKEAAPVLSERAKPESRAIHRAVPAAPVAVPSETPPAAVTAPATAPAPGESSDKAQ